ncbi:MAG: alanine racemase [Rhodoferax sp.]
MKTPYARPTWYEIDLDALEHNYLQLRGQLDANIAIYACLKRNAYGCGTVPVARVLAAAGCNGFAVGNIDDAITAREAGIEQPILLYPNCLPESAGLVQRFGLTTSIASIDEAKQWNDAFDRPQPVFIKVDAGMLRAGVFPSDGEALIRAIAQLPRLQLEGAYGHIHLGKSQEDPAAYARWQIGNFRKFEAAAQAAGVPLPVLMLSSSATLLDFPEADFSAVDPGRLLFGLHSGPSLRSVDLQPVFHGFKTRLVGCRKLDNVDLGGFTPPFEWRPGMRIGLIPVGWGDGLPRELPAGAYALLRGRKVPLLPSMHLEQTRVDISSVPDASLGDVVVLIGAQGASCLPLEEVASNWGSGAAYFHGLMSDHVARRYRWHGSAFAASHAELAGRVTP